MENYFLKYRKNIIGINQTIKTPYHNSIKLLYADWTASGRLYEPIEKRLNTEIYPLVANTHTDNNFTGATMTYAYHKAQQIIKQHVGANSSDVIISSNSGMTGVVNKFQRILGLKIHEKFKQKISIPENERPVVFTTHMEHHSNQTTWLETIADVVIVPPNNKCLVDIELFNAEVEKYANRKIKIAAITSCSNVTGIITPYMDIAKIMHNHNGLCFVDFACSAPYININMHVNDENGAYLDAVFFSPHKFLGGPGTCGVLVFNKKLYHNSVPDNPGGGTVDWTNPWGQHKYISDIEQREDGGTPPFLQTIKTAMCCLLKNEMGVENIKKREEEILKIIWDKLDNISNLHILARDQKERLGVISFYIEGLHYNLGVNMLNDKFGIQVRGGCSCAGTYGHYLLEVDKEYSKSITDLINKGDYSEKPGWIRLSIHPTHTNEEVLFICDAIKALADNFKTWSLDYNCDLKHASFKNKISSSINDISASIESVFVKPYY
ncbi:MAG: aminotransferase class V-fold PLP-dependent enzyme [Bacteroidetes bacterium]|nr:aminotransferase class V-fold PLP-dependent enzyme [Bacteroidota bacterium]